MSWFQSKRPLREWVLALIGALGILPVSALLAISFPPAVAVGLLVLYLVLWLGIVHWSTNSLSWFKPKITFQDLIMAPIVIALIIMAFYFFPFVAMALWPLSLIIWFWKREERPKRGGGR